MTEYTVTVIYWNVWYFAQNNRRGSRTKLINRLDELIQEFRPDVFGLNEVLVRQRDNASPVIDFLEGRGYRCHFAVISPIDETWVVGNLFASKRQPRIIKDHVLGRDTQAERRGHKGFSVKAIEADITYGKVRVTFWLNYFSSLLPLDWGTHLEHRRNYERIIYKISNKNLIVGGDFNETKYMLPWFRLPKEFTRKTGTLLHPTWRLNKQIRYLLFANYDNMVFNHTGNLQLQKFAVLDRSPSDHTPLLGIFKIHPHVKG